MSNEFETEKPFVVTTADMLEIVAGGGNGVEYVDITGLMETAAKELREKDDEIERLRKSRNEILEEAALNAEGFGGSTNDAKNYWAQEISESIRELKRKKPDGYR